MLGAQSSVLRTAQSFAGISRYLRENRADAEDSRAMRSSIAVLSKHIDRALRMRRNSRDAATIATFASALEQGVRQHQLFLTGLGSAWHALYEFTAYQAALRELRSAVQAWHKALEQRSRREGAGFARVELLAWRTLGEGLLLIDLYGQSGDAMDGPRPLPPRRPASRWSRLRQWWGQRRAR